MFYNDLSIIVFMDNDVSQMDYGKLKIFFQDKDGITLLKVLMD